MRRPAVIVSVLSLAVIFCSLGAILGPRVGTVSASLSGLFAGSSSRPAVTPRNRLAPPTGEARPTTTIVPLPPQRSEQSSGQPRWDGVWLRDYQELEGDCAASPWHWVVQPGETDGMLALRLGCFPPQRWGEIVSHCRSARLREPRCAVWDQRFIMSGYNRLGDLKVIALTQACLDRAGLPEYQEGPLHQDCVLAPE